MKYLFRRMFFGKGKTKSTSMNLPEVMIAAVKQVAENTGRSTATEVWVEVMDQFLVQMYREGVISAPSEIEKELKDFIASEADKFQAS